MDREANNKELAVFGPQSQLSIAAFIHSLSPNFQDADDILQNVTSAELTIDEFPRTSGMIWGYIFNGAWHNGFDVPRHDLRLNGVVFDGGEDPAVKVHSNLGVTFDLSAIRKKISGMSIKSFSSVF